MNFSKVQAPSTKDIRAPLYASTWLALFQQLKKEFKPSG
jgi:hypothetical protein